MIRIMPIVGHGIDVVEVSRVAQMLTEHGDHFLNRCFTAGERVVGRNPDGNPGRRYVEHLAARFAAKEAAMKALGTGLSHGVNWTDIEVVKDPELEGAPTLHLYNAARDRAVHIGANHWHVSLSHSETLAVASVIFERDA